MKPNGSFYKEKKDPEVRLTSHGYLGKKSLSSNLAGSGPLLPSTLLSSQEGYCVSWEQVVRLGRGRSTQAEGTSQGTSRSCEWLRKTRAHVEERSGLG